MTKIHPELLQAIAAVTAKRPRTVLNHILKHGHVTTEELQTKYGYDHPPRAARDVREAGIPLETFRVKGSNGRQIGAYRLGRHEDVEQHKLAGRRTFSKAFKATLGSRSAGRCEICRTLYEERYLQVDHRVPYEVAGDSSAPLDPNDFMLLCGSCQRSKSWSCEHCTNWTLGHNPSVCVSCYWYGSDAYTHVAQREERQMNVKWVAEEIRGYETLRTEAQQAGISVGEHMKRLLAERFRPAG